ncbi:MAG: DNA polymerase I [Spirochaetaceae bacterium 4572_59]|nr:MAG: DNA polymerase I [Spirochaetaceae bacterium 4572_59]
MKEPIYLLDGYSVIYRAYFAFIRQPMRNSEGKNVSAVFGFFRTIFSICKKRNTDHLIVLMDSKTKTFRHEMYKEYKANRDKTPDDLHEQIPVIEELLALLGIPCIRVDGYEADDLMGTLAVKASQDDRQVYIITGDKDLLQFVCDKVSVLKPEKGDLTEIKRDDVFEDRGVWPEQIVDYLSLMGDAADNIPGVPGIGPKTASKLLQTFGSLDEIYNRLDEIKSKNQKQKLADNRENAFFSRELVLIKTDCPVPYDEKSLRIKGEKTEEAAKRFMEEGIPTLARELQPDIVAEEKLEAPKNNKKGEYEAVLNEEDLSRWCALVKERGIVSLDCETDSLDPMRANPVGICFSVGGEKACYIPLILPHGDCLPQTVVRSALKPLLEDPAVKVIGQNIKYDWKVLKRWGIDLGDVFFDTMVAAWMVDAGSAVNMDFLAERYLNYKTVHFKDIVPKGKLFSDVPLDEAVGYAAEDADITWRLYEVLDDLLEKKKLKSLFETLEMPLVRILAEMEFRGILLNEVEMDLYSHELDNAIDLLKKEIYTLCGKKFNINSTKQLQEILFVDRKLQPLKKTKSGFSTDTSVLTQLAEEDPVPEKILIYRGLAKLKSTYVDSLPTMINPVSGRLHTSYVQTGAATGRLASRDPNLQNIPVRDENGRRIRKAFYPEKGSIFLSADYSQIELVVLAHLSEDPGLMEAFNKGEDVHRKTASLIFKVPAEEVISSQRRIAKTINFGVMYGMSAFRLSNELKISRAEAKQFIDTYFEEYAGIKRFVDDTVAQAEKDGGVYTLMGRFRPIPQITSKNKMEKSAAERAAVNSRIQGTAADIVKKAMLAMDKKLAEENLKAKVLLQVHDEIILEVPEEEAGICEKILRDVMEGIIQLNVPLNTSIESGKSWGDIH